VNRAGFHALPAVRHSAVHEIKWPLILQPGPAALTDGLAAMEAIIANSVPTSVPTKQPQSSKVSCAAGPARPDGKLK
jgi:hypothetical protein